MHAFWKSCHGKCLYVNVNSLRLCQYLGCWTRLTHQLPLKVVLSYPMQGCDEKCVQIDRFVLRAVAILRKPFHPYAELKGCALDIIANRFLSHVTTWLLKKSQILLFRFHFTPVVSHWKTVSDTNK